MTKAIYALSGDPMTYGHMDIIKRAAAVFQPLIVAIGVNPTKKYLFSTKERTEIARRALHHLPEVEVTSFEGSLVDYAYEQGIPVLVRGVRNNQDFNFELNLHQVGDSQNLGIETFFLPTRQSMSHISSSAVKALQTVNGLIHEYVPLFAKQSLEERLSGQYIIGVTGEIGAGKSYVCEQFQQFGLARGLDVHRIHIDEIGHQILEEKKEPVYREFREQVIETFGLYVSGEDKFINVKALGQILFNNREKLNHFNQLIYKPLLLILRRLLHNKKGLILLDSALITESEMTYLCNHNVLLIKVDKDVQLERLKQRNYTDEQIDKRMQSQYSTKRKRIWINEQIEKDYQGQLWELENSQLENYDHIEDCFEQILNDLGLKID